MKTALSALSEQIRGQMMEIRETKGEKEKDRGGGGRGYCLSSYQRNLPVSPALVHDEGCFQKAKQLR